MNELPEFDQKLPKTQQGFYLKYIVARDDGTDLPGGKHSGCALFVLDLTHDAFALPAIRAYIGACQRKYPKLAEDLNAMYEQAMAKGAHHED